jgi:hypothetical protein
MAVFHKSNSYGKRLKTLGKNKRLKDIEAVYTFFYHRLRRKGIEVCGLVTEARLRALLNCVASLGWILSLNKD